jgi:hypothetical protein
MRKSILAIFLTLGAASSSEVRASGHDGNRLLDKCNRVIRAVDDGVAPSATSEGIEAGHCIGLIKGIIKLNMVYQAKDRDSALFCPPSKISSGQAVRIVVKYMRDNPSELHNEESLVAIAAFIDAYPCADER